MRPHIPEAKYTVEYCMASIRATSLDPPYVWDKVIAHWKEELEKAQNVPPRF